MQPSYVRLRLVTHLPEAQATGSHWIKRLVRTLFVDRSCRHGATVGNPPHRTTMPPQHAPSTHVACKPGESRQSPGLGWRIHLQSRHVRPSRRQRGHPTATAWGVWEGPPASRRWHRGGRRPRATAQVPWRVRRSGGLAAAVPRAHGHHATPPAPARPTRDRGHPKGAIPPACAVCRVHQKGCPPENGRRHPAAPLWRVADAASRARAFPPLVCGGADFARPGVRLARRRTTDANVRAAALCRGRARRRNRRPRRRRRRPRAAVGAGGPTTRHCRRPGNAVGGRRPRDGGRRRRGR